MKGNDSEGRPPFCYTHPRPAVTVDLVVLREVPGPNGADVFEILLIRRGSEPFQDMWALPGGFVETNESPGEAARRELHEEAHLRVGVLRQIGAFGKPGRDPRGWIISIAFAARVRDCAGSIRSGSDAAEARWWPLTSLPPWPSTTPTLSLPRGQLTPGRRAGSLRRADGF